MGCDIHLRTFLYSSNGGEYIDVSEDMHYTANGWTNTNELNKKLNIPTIIVHQNYGLFCVLGNESRVNTWKTIGGLEFGYPEFFETLCKEDSENEDWYGFVHIELKTLKKEIKKYIGKIPNIFKDRRTRDLVAEYKDEISFIKFFLNDILKKIGEIEKISKTPKFKIECDLLGYNIDIDKTMFVIWFDN